MIRSVVTALRTLEELSRGPMGVSDLSRSLGVPKTTAHRSLRTLVAAGWVRVSETDRSKWMLTGRPLTVGLAGSVEGNLRELARAELTELRDATGETVHLVVLDGAELVIVARVDGTHSLRTFLPLGTRAPLHATASGRALLSAMDDAQVAELLGGTLEQFTPSTEHDRSSLLAELERTRERGYALNAAEWRSDIAALGVPIFTGLGVPAASLAISMPLSRWHETDMAAMAELAKRTARRVSEQLHDWQLSDTWLG